MSVRDVLVCVWAEEDSDVGDAVKNIALMPKAMPVSTRRRKKKRKNRIEKTIRRTFSVETQDVASLHWI